MQRTESDDVLLSLATAGDRDALSALLARHGPTVRQSIATDISPGFRRLVDEDDVMQVTYLEAFLRVRELRTNHVEGFTAWLRQIARNNVKDAVKELTRAKRPDPRRQHVDGASDESAQALFELVGMDSATASRIVRSDERKSFLDGALQQLPADYRRVLQEYDLNGTAIEEVASQMGRSQGAIFMLRARALARLREVLPSLSALYGPESL